jgi:hypothetical protein
VNEMPGGKPVAETKLASPCFPSWVVVHFHLGA